MLLSADQSALVVVDIQERLAPVVHAQERITHNVMVLLKAARRLDVPVLASEQYPKGLGATVPALAELLPADSVVEKIHFGCTCETPFNERLAALGRRQVVLTGMEAHICVLQTGIGLLEQGYKVFIVADGTSSRNPANAELGIERMRANGAEVVTTEMVVFEWLKKAGTAGFKELSRLIK
ncbi:MAG TPA: hydrolase [Azospirillaceae bacterium]|nr:hydrolase [Azospirillaceae bacterium]